MFTYMITDVEQRALYRIVRESVMIGGLPHGPQNMNRCQEWGMPRIPVISSMGGDPDADVVTPTTTIGANNPRKEWTTKVLNEVRDSGLKRIRLWLPGEEEDCQDTTKPSARSVGSCQGKQKRRRLGTLGECGKVVGADTARSVAEPANEAQHQDKGQPNTTTNPQTTKVATAQKATNQPMPVLPSLSSELTTTKPKAVQPKPRMMSFVSTDVRYRKQHPKDPTTTSTTHGPCDLPITTNNTCAKAPNSHNPGHSPQQIPKASEVSLGSDNQTTTAHPAVLATRSMLALTWVRPGTAERAVMSGEPGPSGCPHHPAANPAALAIGAMPALPHAGPGAAVVAAGNEDNQLASPGLQHTTTTTIQPAHNTKSHDNKEAGNNISQRSRWPGDRERPRVDAPQGVDLGLVPCPPPQVRLQHPKSKVPK